MSKIGKCVICGKNKRIYCKEKCYICYHREKNISSRKIKVENHKCLNCGKPVKILKCPKCNEIIKYYRRCEKCLTKKK